MLLLPVLLRAGKPVVQKRSGDIFEESGNKVADEQSATIADEQNATIAAGCVLPFLTTFSLIPSAHQQSWHQHRVLLELEATCYK